MNTYKKETLAMIDAVRLISNEIWNLDKLEKKNKNKNIFGFIFHNVFELLFTSSMLFLFFSSILT